MNYFQSWSLCLTPLNFVASFVLSFVGEECKRGKKIDEVRDKAHDKD